MDFADDLREAMGALSQAELSDLSKLRQATISRYLARQRTPGLKELEALERALPRLAEIRAARLERAS